MARVELEHVDKVFPGGTRAICDLTLGVNDGELMVFVGPSGCGKSTLLRLVAGLEESTQGTLRIGGKVVNELTPQQRNVAMVFQDYALYPYLSVRGNLEFPLKMRKLSADEIGRRVQRVAEVLSMAELLDRLPKQLSGGQRQRVAMGRALVREPAVFLLDEPLSNLDAKLRVQVRAEIGELQQRMSTTMIYVTHDQVEAMTLGHRVAVLDRGWLQQVAPPRELYERPANAFVASFIGNPPMNLFPVRLVTDATGGTVITLHDQTLSTDAAGTSAARLQPYLGRKMTGGVRPEALGLTSNGAVDGSIPATVHDLEYVGHETLVHVHMEAANGATPLVARLPGTHGFSKGDVIRLKLVPSQLYLFDEEGNAINREAQSSLI